ncbi:MAG TPA: ester cyclase, partial [Anaerolineaceae bacterium]|nr:ester cyclase [Anaerolineaceae bacterium]
MSTEQIKNFPRRFYDIFNSGDFDRYSDLIDANFVDHNPAPGQSPGIPGLKQALSIFRTGFPDL